LKSQEKVNELKSALQYSLGKQGHGAIAKPIEYFSTEDENEVYMLHSRRQCAGVKVCEFLPNNLREPHTEVDMEGPKWNKLFSQQLREAEISPGQKNEVLFEEYHKRKCDRFKIGHGRSDTCGGYSVICSKDEPNDKDGASPWIGYIWIGCSNYKRGERGHMFYALRSYHDPTIIMRMWLRDRDSNKQRIRVSNRMKLALEFDEDEIDKGTID